jgi:S1-C subfamily serine protease
LSPFGVEWKLFQVSSPLFGGNSGGGVFDSTGKLIGIVSFIRKNVPNMGFIIHQDAIFGFLKNENII